MTLLKSLILAAATTALVITQPGFTTTASIATGNNIDNADNIDIDIGIEILSQKSQTLQQLRRELELKLASFENARGTIEKDVDGLKGLLPKGNHGGANEDGYYDSLDYLYDTMDESSMKLAELTRRTEQVMKKVGRYNRLALAGQLGDQSAALGMEARLNDTLLEEMERRDRYQIFKAQLQLQLQQGAQKMNEALSHDNDDDDDDESITSSKDNAGNEKIKYMTRQELHTLLHPDTILSESEDMLSAGLASLANEQMIQHMSEDDTQWKNHISSMNKRYDEELQRAVGKSVAKSSCLEVPRAVEMVEKALVEHYYDGTNAMDHASYENGGSVVYALTSGGYVPPARHNNDDDDDNLRIRRSNDADALIEQMYHDQQDVMNQASRDGQQPFLSQISEWANRLNLWEWYTSYKFGNLRPYLPEDWERGLDQLPGDWEKYSPRGIMDALIPDYVHHFLGLSNTNGFGSAFGRTAGPEVAITSGWSKSGNAGSTATSAKRSGSPRGGGGSKPLGNCYPLSMRPEDDPVVQLLSNRNSMNAMDLGEVESSALLGPKYTVRLPYPIYIDAVTLEHRSFPMPSSVGGSRGGESAPRWFRVVGFPPCPKNNGHGDREDECGVRGFDHSRPIDLGSFEYHRITVSSKEDEYGGGDDDDEKEEETAAASLDRQRSIQTFAVKGGKWKRSSILVDHMEKPSASPAQASASNADALEEEEDADPTQCSLDSLSCQTSQEPISESSSVGAGQCSFPSDDDDAEPSCGGGDLSSSSSSSHVERHMVEAVSFIIEENWGNADYTCLYRVRVHGDAVAE